MLDDLVKYEVLKHIFDQRKPVKSWKYVYTKGNFGFKQVKSNIINAWDTLKQMAKTDDIRKKANAMLSGVASKANIASDYVDKQFKCFPVTIRQYWCSDNICNIMCNWMCNHIKIIGCT